jgi:hypothetical protein
MPFKSEKQRKWMWANDPEMAKKWEEEEEKEQNETVNLNPNMNVQSMGNVTLPGNPGSANSFSSQTTGSGDLSEPLKKKKKRKKKKKLISFDEFLKIIQGG